MVCLMHVHAGARRSFRGGVILAESRAVPRLCHCLPALVAAVCILGRFEPALACGPLPCAQVNGIQPPEGSVGVPLNTEIRVLYFGSLTLYGDSQTCNLDLRPIRLLPDTGEPIYLTGTVLPRPATQEAWTIAKHVAPLAANTVFAVQLLLGEGREPCRCEALEWTTVSSFTSGAAEDHEPPTFAGLDSLEYGERLQGSNDCGGSDLIYVFPEFSHVSDDGPAPRYNIYVDGQIAQRYVEELDFDQYGEIFVDCGSSSLTTLTAVTPGASVEVRGVDLAGNESTPNTPLTIDAACDTPTTEVPEADRVANGGTSGSAPIAASPTSSADTAVPSVSSMSSSGCALSRRSASDAGAPSAVMFGALLVLFGSRAASRGKRERAPARATEPAT
jgi:hypothetical protein